MVTKTINSGADSPFLVDLDPEGCGKIDFLAGAECWVKASADALEAAPGAVPNPGTNQQSDFIYLPAGGRFVVDLNQGVVTPAAPANLPMKRLVGWSVGAGKHLLVAN